MASKIYPWAPLPNVVSIRIDRPTNSSDEEIVLVGELRCGVDVISENGASYEFGLTRLTLSLDPSGCSIKQGRRVGDQKEQFKVKERATATRKLTREAGLKAGADGDAKASASLDKLPNHSVSGGLAAHFGANVSLRSQSEEDEHVLKESIFHPFISNGLNEVVVAAPDGEVLRSAFLQSEDLCTILISEKLFYSLTATVCFQPRDIVFIEASLENRSFLAKDLSKNKVAFAKLLIARKLASRDAIASTNRLTKIEIAADVFDGPKIEGKSQ